MEFDYPKRELDMISPKNSINKLNISRVVDPDILEDNHMLSSAYINFAEINFDQVCQEIYNDDFIKSVFNYKQEISKETFIQNIFEKANWLFSPKIIREKFKSKLKK